MTQTAPPSLDLSDERERLERAQHDLSQKERGSANWERQRQVVAERHADLKRKRRDFLHKLSNYYATEYDLVAVEGLDAKELVELPETHGIGRERRGTFLRMLEYKCEREGTHFAEVDPRERRRKRASCASRRTSRCGFVNTRVPRVGLRRTGTRTQRGTFFLAVLKIGVVHSESTLWRLRSLRTPLCLQSASSKQEAPSPEVKDFGLAVRTRRVLTTTPRSERRQP